MHHFPASIGNIPFYQCLFQKQILLKESFRQSHDQVRVDVEYIRKALGIKHGLIESAHNRTVPTCFPFLMLCIPLDMKKMLACNFEFVSCCPHLWYETFVLSDFGVSLRHKNGLFSSPLFGSLVHFRSPSLPGLVRLASGKKTRHTCCVSFAANGGKPSHATGKSNANSWRIGSDFLHESEAYLLSSVFRKAASQNLKQFGHVLTLKLYNFLKAPGFFVDPVGMLG